MITFILAVCGNVDYVYSFPLSPPSRAAWIEMSYSNGVSRENSSPPSRAAWIEIAFCQLTHTGVLESPPSRGGVDLNLVLHYRNI